MTRYEAAIAAVDKANAADPHEVVVEGRARPAELVYGERMSAMLWRLQPEAQETLRLAVRAQHLRRFEVPRATYPMDRSGYHRWRNDLKRKHAAWAGEILHDCGYSDAAVARVGALIRKDNLKSDAEAQVLEDTACLVFLAHYATDFATRHENAKVLEILRKTWSKMSKPAREMALTLDLPEAVRSLVGQAVGSVA